MLASGEMEMEKESSNQWSQDWMSKYSFIYDKSCRDMGDELVLFA